jgi:hypothetical protein
MVEDTSLYPKIIIIIIIIIIITISIIIIIIIIVVVTIMVTLTADAICSQGVTYCPSKWPHGSSRAPLGYSALFSNPTRLIVACFNLWTLCVIVGK